MCKNPYHVKNILLWNIGIIWVRSWLQPSYVSCYGMYHGEQKHHHLDSLCHAHEEVTKWVFHPRRNQLSLTCVCCNVERDQCYFFLKCQILTFFVMVGSHHIVKYMLKSPYTIRHLSLQIMSFFGQAKWRIEFIAKAIFLMLHVANSNWSLGSTLSKPTTYSSCFACIKITIFWNFQLGWWGHLICKTWSLVELKVVSFFFKFFSKCK